MKHFIVLLLAGLLLNACAPPSTAPAIKKDSTKEDSTTTAFLPVADYLRSEISYVDSTPLAIRKSTTRNNHRDSSFIQQGEFNRLSQEFLAPELAADSFKKNYSETSFMDKTTGYLTFTYSPLNKDLPLRRVDVLAAPGTGMDKVKSIYLERAFPSGDTTVVKKMFWQTGHSFLVLTSLRLAGKVPVESQLKVIWNSDDDTE